MRKILPYLAVGLLLITVVNLGRAVVRMRRVSAEVEDLRTGAERLEQEKKELSAKINEAQTPEFVEKELREKLGMGREGETILVLPKQDEKANSQYSIVNRGENLENWEKWARVFGFK